MTSKLVAMLTGCFLMVSPLLCGAGTTLVLYDNFREAAIDQARWTGYEAYDNEGLSRECVREIEGGSLRLTDHAYGLITTDPDAACSSGQRLRMVDGSAVTAMQGTITMTKAVVKNPASGPEAVVGARIGGYFFNVGSPTPGDSTGDIVAEVGLVRTSTYTRPNTVGIFGYVYQCLDSGCGTLTDIGVTTALGLVQVGQPVNVSVQWDKTNHQFTFQYIIAKRNVQSQSIPYVVSDSSPPATNNKRLEVNTLVPPCAAAPCTEAAVEALFGPVYVNQ
ncbi:MAG: hypothetical protein ACLQVJ_28055 [Syntrophobacteraceae bacterium]